MTVERRFPVLWQGSRALFANLAQLGCPRSVPWSFLAPHEQQARYNHGQTLERLASRGGLSPAEMVAVLKGKPLREMLPSDEAAVPILLSLLSTPPNTEETTNAE